MPRSTKEWIGKSDDTPIPPRVRLRVFLKFDGRCQECTLAIVGKRWICDHTVALVNGGENRESNLRPIHEACDKSKTAKDVEIKSKTYRTRSHHLGIKRRSSGPLLGSRASGWKRKMDGTWEKR